MGKAKERILKAALGLFARRGFQGVSVRDIAQAVELTPPALYAHFASKQEVLEAILRRMEEQDAEMARGNGVPALPRSQDPAAYQGTGRRGLAKFTREIFLYWAEDDFAVPFRQLLTIEQYRDARFAALYQQYFGQGVLAYLEDLLRELFPREDPRKLALAFYAPLPFLWEQYGIAKTQKEKRLVLQTLNGHLQRFLPKE
ncbi:MAG: TetR/AcrR family transcriptional regulator [Oligosphaeraceae bacterium]